MLKNRTLNQQQNFLHRFQEVVHTFPDHIAVLENGTVRTTYWQLFQSACQVAQYLESHCENERVGISIDKSAAYIAALLGCWLAKKTLIPLDRRLPEARRNFIIQDSDIGLILTDHLYDECLATSALFEVNLEIETNHPAYIIYTSGTTGMPKGVLVSHNGIVNLADCQKRAFEMDETSNYLFYLSTNFDASISDISVTLLSGATLVIENEDAISIATALPELIASRQITHMDIPPSLLKILDINAMAPCLKTIIIGGEVADRDTVRKWSKIVNLVNVYGPTEATVCTSLCRCNDTWSEPLLGHPIGNTEYRIFDEHGQPCDTGELYIGGIGLALGYINNEALTQQKFVVIENRRYYRTGDRVVMLPNGDIQFLGRIDRQVKLRGQLVELEEIETRLNEHPQVFRSAVLKRPIIPTGREHLVAFIQPKDKSIPVAKEAILESLKPYLPAWMIPTGIELMEALPLTASGKVDQKRLSDYPLHWSTQEDAALTSALTENEQVIADIFKSVLKIDVVAADDNFFDLGGDSLGTVEFMVECENRGLDIAAEFLNENPTPRSIAKHMDTQSTVKMSVAALLSDTLNDWVEETQTHAIFLTGSTGFLGSALLSELLATTEADIYCLVRAKDEPSAYNRIRKTFSDYQVPVHPEFERRVHVICGDIGQEHFGLSKAAYEQLADQMDSVYHCAAVVNMVAPYQKLKNINLDGVKRVLAFCCQGKRKPLHYASTLSVFVSTDQNEGIVLEEDRLAKIQTVYGGYGQTKFAAEKYLLAVPPARCDIFIYRFGLLTGSTHTRISAKGDFLGMFVQGAKALGTLPHDDTNTLAVDITPIDYAARAMCLISVSDTRHRIFHIANPEPLQYNNFLQVLKEEKVISAILPYPVWEIHIQGKQNLSTTEHVCLMSLCRFNPETFEKKRVMDLFQATGIQFDTRNVQDVLGLELICPRPDTDLIAGYVRHFIADQTVQIVEMPVC